MQHLPSTMLAAIALSAVVRHVQGMRANEYPADPAAALEGWARARWPAAGQRLYQWSYQVQSADCTVETACGTG